ncbi:MAG: type II CAAX prenyl endopeptidase Rce1 family protein [Candidatus Ventricola sp.]
MTNEEREIIPRILRDMNDGVLVLDRQGTILFLNEQGRTLLGQQTDVVGMKYAAALLGQDAKNDAFHQFVLDAVYDKEHTHSGEASYLSANQEERRFRLTSSFLRSEDGTKPIGVVVLFSDITEIDRLHRQRRESSTVFAVLMICVCTYLFLWSLLRYLNAEPPGWAMSMMIEAISIVMFFIILKTTSFSIRDIGLRITDARATFLPDILITAGCVAVLVLGKVVLLRAAPGFFPAGAPFWDWSVGSVASVFYPLTVILQEFLARGVMQENLRRIFTGRHAGALSIVVSALVFGVLHISYGLPYMLAASLLLGVMGVLYHKQGNIWGLCIIHYVLGQAATFLRYIV